MAATILRRYQELWNRAALTELLSGFTDDIVVEFADLPRIKGKAELERILKARLARAKRGYRLEKTLRAANGASVVGPGAATFLAALPDWWKTSLRGAGVAASGRISAKGDARRTSRQ